MYLKVNVVRVLVAGGAGFIGSHLCKYLLSKGHNVICLDSLETGYKKNIKSILGNNNFEFIKHDIINAIDISDINQIYHLACPGSPKKYQIDPIHTIKTNIIGTENLLNLARRNNARFFLSSTSEVYGEPLQHPQSETYFGNVNTIGPRSCYDEGKRCAETLTYEFHAQFGVQTRIARIFNTYGPQMHIDDGRVVSNFIVNSLLDKNMLVYGGGRQTRCFCYINDTIKGLIHLMSSDCMTPVNIGSDHEITIYELAKLVAYYTNKSLKVRFLPRPQNDPVRRKPDLEKAKELLKWNAATPLEVGLCATIHYFEKELVSNA